MIFELNFLEKERSGLNKSVKKFRVYCGVEWEAKGDVRDHSENSVTEVAEILLFD
jgi:hypothetical protein